MSRDSEKQQNPATKPKPPKNGPADHSPGPLSDREARLAEALRANLRRRKAQARSRKQGLKSDAGPAES